MVTSLRTKIVLLGSTVETALVCELVCWKLRRLFLAVTSTFFQKRNLDLLTYIMGNQDITNQRAHICQKEISHLPEPVSLLIPLGGSGHFLNYKSVYLQSIVKTRSQAIPKAYSTSRDDLMSSSYPKAPGFERGPLSVGYFSFICAMSCQFLNLCFIVSFSQIASLIRGFGHIL